jgi:hypothetical protein
MGQVLSDSAGTSISVRYTTWVRELEGLAKRHGITAKSPVDEFDALAMNRLKLGRAIIAGRRSAALILGRAKYPLGTRHRK